MTKRDFETGKTSPFTPVEAPKGATPYWNVSVYKFLHDCMDGTGGFEGKDISYLVEDKTENFYNTRNLMSHFVNDMARFINSQFTRVYTDVPPDYSGTTDPSLVAMIKNIDRRGSSIDEMKMYGLQYGLLDGAMFMASGNDGAEGETPWNIIYTALEYKEDLSEVDMHNNITEYVFMVSKGVYHRYTDKVFQVLTDEKETCDISKMDIVSTSDVPEQVVRTISTIPSYGKTTLPYPKSTKAIAKMCLNLYELHSRMVQLMTRQLFDRLVITGEVDSVPEGMTNALQLNGENAGAETLSPDPNVTKAWKEVIEMYTSILYEHMRDGGVIVQTTTPESGYSKEYTFQPVEAAYKRSVTVSRKMDMYAQDSYNLWMKKNSVLDVQYNTKYTPVDPITSMQIKDIFEVTKELGVDSLLAEVGKKVMDYIGVDQSSPVYAKISKELDNIRVGISE